MVRRRRIMSLALSLISLSLYAQELNPLDMRWTFGAHEPYTMYRRVGKQCTGGIDGNARWLGDWLNWFDNDSPAVMEELGLNWLHCRFYKGMGWNIEKQDFDNVKKLVGNCHSHGVHVLAYVQFSTLYPEVMKKEIPQLDSWQAVGMDGQPVRWKPETYYRMVPCIHCAEWEEYLKKICTIALTEGGFDGIMFDNAFSTYCCCDRCQKSFKEYLSSIPDKKERFGFEDLSDFSIPSHFTQFNYAGEIREPLMQAWIEWRTNSLTQIFLRLREHIKSIKPDAIVSANAPTFRCWSNTSDRGVNMVELAEAFDLLIGQSENYPSYNNGIIINRIRELKIARDIKKPIVALCDVDAKMTPEQEKHYLLPLYEDLVFGGVPTDRTVLSPKAVPGFIDKEKLNRRKPQLAAFNALVKEHRDLFEAPVYAPVRLFYPEYELQFSQSSQEALCAAEEILSRRQIPWGYLVSTPSNPFSVPSGTEVIIVPGLKNLSQEQTMGLVQWAKNGGKLIVTGDSGRYDRYNAQYLENPFLKELKNCPNAITRAIEDAVHPAVLSWVNKVGAPEDHGETLLKDLKMTGFKLPFTIDNCPEYVAMDARIIDNGYVLHFVNYNPQKPVVGLKINGKTINEFSEYTFIKIKNK